MLAKPQWFQTGLNTVSLNVSYSNTHLSLSLKGGDVDTPFFLIHCFVKTPKELSDSSSLPKGGENSSFSLVNCRQTSVNLQVTKLTSTIALNPVFPGWPWGSKLASDLRVVTSPFNFSVIVSWISVKQIMNVHVVKDCVSGGLPTVNAISAPVESFGSGLFYRDLNEHIPTLQVIP